MDAISISHLTKYYGKHRGIEDVSFAVAEGEFFGFIGSNGAGKSTTIRTLLGLIRPSAGTASVLGLDIVRDREKILARTGYLPSEIMLYAGMRVKEVLRLSAGLRSARCEKRAEELCERLQLDASRKVDELSFGNRKKVAIVCALQHEPELLILDEPTGGLDPLMQKEFFDIMQEQHRAGKTIFMSGHVLTEIRKYCERAAILREGRVVACDRMDALTRTNTKRVQLQGHAAIETLSGIRDIRRSEEGMSFLYQGELAPLMGVLASGAVRDLTIAEPDLEEIFLHYYQEDAISCSDCAKEV